MDLIYLINLKAAKLYLVVSLCNCYTLLIFLICFMINSLVYLNITLESVVYLCFQMNNEIPNDYEIDWFLLLQLICDDCSFCSPNSFKQFRSFISIFALCLHKCHTYLVFCYISEIIVILYNAGHFFYIVSQILSTILPTESQLI